MNPRLILGLGLAALAASACATATPTAPPDASPSTRIEVTLSDSLTISPNPMIVPLGVPVTFVVHNGGVLEHELFLGDEAAQEQHGKVVSGAGGVPQDSDSSVAVKPGETRELTFTFAAGGSTLAGCHVPGHYQAGMKATVEVR